MLRKRFTCDAFACNEILPVSGEFSLASHSDVQSYRLLGQLSCQPVVLAHSTKLSLNAFLIAVEGSSLYSILQRVFHRHIDDRENANT